VVLVFASRVALLRVHPFPDQQGFFRACRFFDLRSAFEQFLANFSGPPAAIASRFCAVE